ncbi:MAG: hypothetical protein R3C26_17845 [Calditrichia bacterium]
MKIKIKFLVFCFVLCVAGVVTAQDNLVPQSINFTENPVDIPNPDRGFYRPQSYVIPVDSGTPGFPDLGAVISGTTVFVNASIVYMEFDLRNFSSNAPLNRMPLGPGVRKVRFRRITEQRSP